MTDADIKRVVFAHTKLNPNQADDQVLLDGIVRAVRQILVLDATPCERCGGAGHIEVPEGRGPDVSFMPVNCPACDGTGTGADCAP